MSEPIITPDLHQQWLVFQRSPVGTLLKHRMDAFRESQMATLLQAADKDSAWDALTALRAGLAFTDHINATGPTMGEHLKSHLGGKKPPVSDSW